VGTENPHYTTRFSIRQTLPIQQLGTTKDQGHAGLRNIVLVVCLKALHNIDQRPYNRSNIGEERTLLFVVLQATKLRETLATLVARERSLARVDARVLFKVVIELEAFAAYLAYVRAQALVQMDHVRAHGPPRVSGGHGHLGIPSVAQG